MAWALGIGFDRVTIDATDDYLGVCRLDSLPEWFDWELYDEPSRVWLANVLRVTLAGPLAELRACASQASVTDGASQDFEHVAEYAIRLSADAAYAEQLEAEVARSLNGLWPDVERIAEALAARRTLTASDVWAILEGGESKA
jgi:hypothetical protein